MQTHKSAAILADLKKLDPWLQSMGVAPKNDRIHNAIALLREAEAISKGEQKPPTSGEKFIFGLTEALEIHGILTAFEAEGSAVLREKLLRAFSGPYHPAHETSATSDGRNVMFELSLAAQMRRRGLPTHIGEPDVLLDVGPGFFIECKRPFRESSIRPSIREAAAQLDTNLETDKGKYGMVAISASRLLNSGDKLFVGPSEQLGSEQLGDMMERLARANERHWQKMGCSSRIVAVLFHASTPAIFRDKTIIYELSYVHVFSIGPNTPELKILQDTMTMAFGPPRADS